MAIGLAILFSTVVVLHPIIVHVIAAVLLCVFGLVTNLVQAICFVCIWPISKNMYTRINCVVKEWEWRVLISILYRWSGILMIHDITEHTTSHLKGEENEVIILNAKNRLVDPILAQWSGFLGILVAVVKTSARYSPVKGWGMRIFESVFSRRRCIHDASQPKSDLVDFLQPFWLSVVLERTGFTQRDLRAAQRLPVSSRFLSSDTKVHVYIKWHETKKWPETDEAVEKWYTEILAAKSALLDDDIVERTFGDKRLQAIGQPPKCFLVGISSILFWALKLNFVSSSTLFVFGTALLSGRMLALFGYGVLSMLRCLMGAAISRITWSDHLEPICDFLIQAVFEALLDLDLSLDW